MNDGGRPPLRLEFVAEEEVSTPELRRRHASSDPRILWRLLVRRAGASEYRELYARDVVQPGDTVLVWNVDVTDEAEIERAVRSFNETVYLNSFGDAWPDEHAIIARVVPPRGARVLEICCGAGRVTPYLVREGNAVTALDISADSIEFARATDRHGIEYVVGDAAALPFADGSFDVACGFENTLGMVWSKRPRVLSELVRVCQDGGRVIVAFREEPGPRMHLYHARSGDVEVAETFTRKGAEALVAGLPPALGARVRAVEHHAGGPRPWGGSEFYLVLAL